ncbi:MAG TPA: 23S rRNA (uracil(1939)-C(5))-methyltransferase RlmD, partial [Bacillota bacterium]|nr:23S rRNA (uracil(1939)-C(5))-methyltransferase RlmD [Bacillota bacterium]
MKIAAEKPVQLGQTVEITIDNYGHEGEGVGRIEGFAVFIPEALKGETVRIRITEVRKNFARGEVLEILKPAVERIKPPCPVYQQCGGCQLQHMNYQAQLALKRQQVVDAVERIGGLSGITVHPVLGMKDPWYYRNKVQYPFGMDGGQTVMGFYRKGTHDIVNLDSCQLQPMVTNWVATKIRELAVKYQVSIYNEQTGTGLLRHLLIKKGFKTGEMMVVLVTNGPDFPDGPKIAAELMSAFPNVKSVVQNINTNRGNVILGRETRVIAGEPTINDILDGLKFKISARSFFQVNPEQAEVLYHKAVEYAGLTGTETVLDAYCGVGSLTLFLARQAKEVYGIEVVPEAIRDAEANAALNQMQNARFLVGETEKVLPELVKQGIRFDVGVVDPPRSGCERSVLESFAANGVGRIVYVSCNPSTLARDLKILTELGYEVREIQPVDMFPQTYHV